jgi:hypothetical protein
MRLAAAGAVLLHLWTQSLELEEIEHVLQEYVNRKKKDGQQVGCGFEVYMCVMS